MKNTLIAGLATFAVLAGGTTIALAQDGNPDGGPPLPGQIVNTQCGAQETNLVRTQSSPGVTSAPGWALLPASNYAFNVPAGDSDCVKLLFTAETACAGFAGNDFCYVQALIDGIPMDPNGANFQAMDSEDPTASAHAYEWVKRVGAGNHVLTIQQRVGNAATNFYTDDWTEDITIQD